MLFSIDGLSRTESVTSKPNFHTLRKGAALRRFVHCNWELRCLSLNFHIHVSVSELYISTMGLPFLLEEIQYVVERKITFIWCNENFWLLLELLDKMNFLGFCVLTDS